MKQFVPTLDGALPGHMSFNHTERICSRAQALQVTAEYGIFNVLAIHWPTNGMLITVV